MDCVLCGRPATGFGEHVVPNWLLKRWIGQGPFTFEVNGTPVPDRDGKPRTSDHLPPVQLPVCSEQDWPGDSCNGWLNRRYEEAGKPVVRRVLDGDGKLSSREVVELAEWWVKTILLWRHPMARSTVPGVELISWDVPASTYHAWRRTGVLPDEISLWIAVVDYEQPRGRRTRLSAPGRLHIPTTIGPAGSGGKPVGGTFTLHMRQQSRAIVVNLLMHPLVDVDHAFESAGLSARIWPDPGRPLDLGRLRVLDRVGADQFSQHVTLLHEDFEVALNPEVSGPSNTRFRVNPVDAERLLLEVAQDLPRASVTLEDGERHAVAALRDDDLRRDLPVDLHEG